MMKILKYIAVIAGVSLTLQSCDDIFRDEPIDKLPDTAIWGDEQLLNEYTSGWYRHMDEGFYVLVSTAIKNNGVEYDPWYGDQLTVGRSDWYQSGYGDILKGSQTQITSRSRLKWEEYYTEIRAINLLMEHENEMPANVRKRLMGEAHFFRAWYYYTLWRRYGGVMIIDHSFNPLKEKEKFPRASFEEMVTFITGEAEKAAALLEPTNEASHVGRATRGAALMLKGKAYFWAAGAHFQNVDKSYLGFPDDRSAEMLDAAAKCYDRVEALHVYDLVPIAGTSRDEVVAAYRNIFLTKNSQESIWEVQHSDDGDFMYAFGHKLDRDASSPVFTGVNCAYNPTQNHVDEYRMANGKRIDEQGSGYDEEDPYVGRDYRFYANVLYDGAMWRGHEMELHYNVIDGKEVAGADLTRYGSSTTASISRTGYYMAKFLRENQTIDADDTYASSQNCILWRYAEMLLDYAEIDYRLGRPGPALKKVNRIRERVHMPALTSVTLDDILNERRVELAFEKTTYWDLLRLGEAEDRMCGDTNPLYGVKIVYDEDGDKRINLSRVVNGRNTNVRYFAPRQYFWPIAWDDVRYHGIPQNPDWTEV